MNCLACLRRSTSACRRRSACGRCTYTLRCLLTEGASQVQFLLEKTQNTKNISFYRPRAAAELRVLPAAACCGVQTQRCGAAASTGSADSCFVSGVSVRISLKKGFAGSLIEFAPQISPRRCTYTPTRSSSEAPHPLRLGSAVACPERERDDSSSLFLFAA